MPLPPGADAVHPQVSIIVENAVLNMTLSRMLTNQLLRELRISATKAPTTARTHVPIDTPVRGRPACRLPAIARGHKRSRRRTPTPPSPKANPQLAKRRRPQQRAVPARQRDPTPPTPQAPTPETPPQTADTSSDTSDETPSVTPHQVTMVWSWWNKEIAPWSHIILGAGGARGTLHRRPPTPGKMAIH